MLDTMTDYPITDSNLPFADYLKQCQTMIANRREDLQLAGDNRETILHANSPFEYRPQANNQSSKVGVLLIHGLLDCPFTYRELAAHLHSQGMLCRSIILPGHGTRPSDLLDVTYHDWLQTVHYGIESLKNEVDAIYLIGYSTGAALSIYHALQESRITGLVLIAPAIKIRTPVDVAVNWYQLAHCLGKDKRWVYHCKETDYTKYKSIPFNSVKQVSKLTKSIRASCRAHPIKQPIYMILSREDETISSHDAINFFSSMHHANSKLLVYSSTRRTYPDSRITMRNGRFKDLKISHLAHASLSFSAANSHYGTSGDYAYASRLESNAIYGAYNRLKANAFGVMAKYKLTQQLRQPLTYNPDFDYMAASISTFIADIQAMQNKQVNNEFKRF
jgi:esterase/lipase